MEDTGSARKFNKQGKFYVLSEVLIKVFWGYDDV